MGTVRVLGPRPVTAWPATPPLPARAEPQGYSKVRNLLRPSEHVPSQECVWPSSSPAMCWRFPWLPGPPTSQIFLLGVLVSLWLVPTVTHHPRHQQRSLVAWTSFHPSPLGKVFSYRSALNQVRCRLCWHVSQESSGHLKWHFARNAALKGLRPGAKGCWVSRAWTVRFQAALELKAGDEPGYSAAWPGEGPGELGAWALPAPTSNGAAPWKPAWRLLEMLTMERPSDPALPSLGPEMHQQKRKQGLEEGSAATFAAVLQSQQLRRGRKHVSTDACVGHSVRAYNALVSAVRRTDILTPATTRHGQPRGHSAHQMSQSQRDRSCLMPLTLGASSPQNHRGRRRAPGAGRAGMGLERSRQSLGLRGEGSGTEGGGCRAPWARSAPAELSTYERPRCKATNKPTPRSPVLTEIQPIFSRTTKPGNLSKDTPISRALERPLLPVFARFLTAFHKGQRFQGPSSAIFTEIPPP